MEFEESGSEEFTNSVPFWDIPAVRAIWNRPFPHFGETDYKRADEAFSEVQDRITSLKKIEEFNQVVDQAIALIYREPRKPNLVSPAVAEYVIDDNQKKYDAFVSHFNYFKYLNGLAITGINNFTDRYGYEFPEDREKLEEAVKITPTDPIDDRLTRDFVETIIACGSKDNLHRYTRLTLAYIQQNNLGENFASKTFTVFKSWGEISTLDSYDIVEILRGADILGYTGCFYHANNLDIFLTRMYEKFIQKKKRTKVNPKLIDGYIEDETGEFGRKDSEENADRS